MQNKYTYEFTDRRGTKALIPAGEYGLKFTDEQAQDGRVDYIKKLTGDLHFSGADFDWLFQSEKSRYRAESTTLVLKEKGIPVYTCRLNFSNGDWFVDKCVLKIQAQSINAYQGFEDIKNSEINIFSFTTPNKTVHLLESGVVFESKEFENTVCNDINPIWTDPGDPIALGWQVYYNYYKKVTDLVSNIDVCSKITRWIRENKTVTCDITLDETWTLISNTCPGGSKVYVRPASLYRIQAVRTDEIALVQRIVTYIDEFGVTGYSNSLDLIDNGMLFEDIIQGFAAQIGLIFRSDFFQYNPYVATDINYVTGKKSITDHIVIYQKSDVKRPNVSNNAVQALFTIEKQLATLVNMFNCRWRISAGVLQIEHISYWNKNTGLDLRQSKYIKNVFFKKEYTYETDKLPHLETFTFMDFSPYPSDFTTAKIAYVDNNAQPGTEGEKNINLDSVTTNINLCLQNPDSDSKVVNDLGFVYVSCNVQAGTLYVNRALPIDETYPQPNNVFGWTHLIKYFFYHNRPFLRGKVNNVPTVFLTVDPSKKGVDIDIPNCSPDIFNPFDQVLTPFGWGPGIVSKASFVPHSNNLTLTLLYNQEYGLTQSLPPVAVNDSVFCYVSAEVDISVLLNDLGVLPDIQGVIITVLPTHGTLLILPGNVIKYKPDLLYLGADTFKYKIKDFWGDLSNEATVFISVINFSMLPVANPDNYNTDKNTVLNIAAPGILINDTDDQPGLVVTAGVFDTAEHGTITLYADGHFSYIPPVDFTGTDYYDYTITDSDGNTAIGRITILVRVTGAVDGVYVQMLETNPQTFSDVTALCDANPDGHRYVERKYFTYTLKYFADAFATVPLDITGYGIQIKIHMIETDAGFPPFIHDDLHAAYGSVQLLYGAFEVYHFDEGCPPFGEINRTQSITLLPNGYNVI